jgi:alkanesulfonate monooxygenase SsuD/methylene tetrahydromethanopterin reductase-like flavin-dependent oxidoreductase (luciferase family)
MDAVPPKPVQFGIFLPIANGGWITSRTAPPIDGSFELNRRTAILAESLGFDFLLSMMKWRGFGGAANHWGHSMESMILMSALSQVMSRIKIWCIVHSLLHNPAVAAKLVATLDHASGERAGLNIVSGAYRDEFEQMGMWRDDLDHDQRYEVAEEWIESVRKPMQTLIYCTVVPAATDAEAQARVERYRDGIDLETVAGMGAAFSPYAAPRRPGEYPHLARTAGLHVDGRFGIGDNPPPQDRRDGADGAVRRHHVHVSGFHRRSAHPGRVRLARRA